jgi:hypothetical protein
LIQVPYQYQYPPMAPPYGQQPPPLMQNPAPAYGYAPGPYLPPPPPPAPAPAPPVYHQTAAPGTTQAPIYAAPPQRFTGGSANAPQSSNVHVQPQRQATAPQPLPPQTTETGWNNDASWTDGEGWDSQIQWNAPPPRNNAPRTRPPFNQKTSTASPDHVAARDLDRFVVVTEPTTPNPTDRALLLRDRTIRTKDPLPHRIQPSTDKDKATCPSSRTSRGKMSSSASSKPRSSRAPAKTASSPTNPKRDAPAGSSITKENIAKTETNAFSVTGRPRSQSHSVRNTSRWRSNTGPRTQPVEPCNGWTS